MTTPGSHDGGRVVAPAKLALIPWALAAAALSSASACTPRGQVEVAKSDGPDAAVTFHSEVTAPATWVNLWGSWPSARYGEGSAYDSDRSVMVIFGGQLSANGPYYTDTWEWNSVRGAWNERTPAATSPAERAGHVMVYDTARKKTFLFSGWQPQASFFIPEQWEWDGTTATWTQRIISGMEPKPRYAATMVWDPDRSRAVLFGGFCYDVNTDTSARCNDIWEWDGTGTGTWTNRTPAATANSPSARMYHGATYDTVRKKMIVYGGYTGTGPATTGTWVDETWEWDGSAGTWMKSPATGATGIPYYSSDIHIAYDVSRGKTYAYYYYYYMWQYDPTAQAWVALTTPTRSDNDTPPYTNETFLYDPARKFIVAYGGQSGSVRDVEEFDGTADLWTNRSVPFSGPIQRSSPQVAYDSKDGRFILFGGHSSVDGLYKQDTWSWTTGTDETWKSLTNANAKPAGRQSGGMVYDSKRDQMILFGGYGQAYYNDVWTWSPTTQNWSPVTVNGTPPPTEYNFWMFYDVARDKVIVYSNYYTIWEYDVATSTWTNRGVTTGNPTGITQRLNYQVTYDSDRGKLLLIGGYGYVTGVGNVYDADVWEWDTTTAAWTERAPAAGAAAPPGRYDHGVTYDSNRRLVVLFGGYGEAPSNVNTPLNDSWEWDGVPGTWTATSPDGVRPLARYNHIQLFDSLKATTLVFGGTVPDDGTYGPQEIWEYLANTAPRQNGSGCSPSAASSCASGNCVDGVCCAQTKTECSGTCKACNVAGQAGNCLSVPAGLPDDTCPSDQVCDPTQQCKQKLGHACTTFSDCGSGHCADGVCCNTDCNGTCMQCNLNNSLGTCARAPTGNEDPDTCASDPNTTRFCDASGVCTNGTKALGQPCTASGQCGSMYCIDGVCCVSSCATTCYSCALAGTLGSCYPIPAGLPDHSATTPCDMATQYCTGAGACGNNKKPNGLGCTTSTDCGSGFCVDGYCCNSMCTGTCQSCGVTGNLGSCVNIPAGSQDSSPACNGTQYCDGKGVCQSGLKANAAACAAGTECGSGNCADGVCCDASCTAACYACNLPSAVGICTGVATGAADACPSPQYCTSDHTCTTGKKTNGSTCASPSDCASGNCVDKTCCDSACGGNCQTCANATGTCTLVAAGVDPRGSCKGTDPMCGGTCDGQGGCVLAASGKPCRQAGCQTDLQIIFGAAAYCDGAGNCPPGTVTDCKGFGCYTDANNMGQCKTDCATDPDCAIKRYCQTGGDGGTVDGGGGSQCPAQLPLGSTCVRDSQCLSGTCAINRGATSGVCCNTQCSTCGTCDATGNCHPYAAGMDPNMDCIGNDSDPTHKCGGMCDGHAHCAYPAAGASCGLCKACNGVGLCTQVPADDSACLTIDCSALNTSCLDYHDLTTNRCASLGVCKTPNNKTTCTNVTDTCGPDGGAGGSGGGGTNGGGGATGTGGANGGGGRGGTTGGGGTGTGGAGAGTGGSGTLPDGGTADGGKPAGGGGGCGCDLGGANPVSVLPVLLVFAGVVTARRRRR